MVDDEPAVAASLDEEALLWVERFAQGRGRRADVAALKQWMARSAAHAEAFDRVSRVWTSLAPVGQQLAARGLIARVASQPSAHAERPALGRRAFLGGALAASVAGAAAIILRPPLDLWPSISELAADYRTRPGEQRHVALPAQVSIEMNTRTSVAIRAAGSEAELVAGEVVISASGQEKSYFVLRAGAGRIVGTGASFNARIDGDAVCVTCTSGEMRVELDGAVLPLGVGQQVIYSDRGVGKPVSVDPAVVTAWQRGVVIFEATPVADVVAEVNRYRPGRIVLTNHDLGRRVFNARLRIENIGNVVRQIELAFGAHATHLPGGIVLLG